MANVAHPPWIALRKGGVEMRDNAGIEFETLSPREALEFGLGIVIFAVLVLTLSALAPGGLAGASELSSAVDMTPTHARSQLALQSPFVAQAGLAEVGSGGGGGGLPK